MNSMEDIHNRLVKFGLLTELALAGFSNMKIAGGYVWDRQVTEVGNSLNMSEKAVIIRLA